MKSDRPKPSEAGRVILFRPRQAGCGGAGKARPPRGPWDCVSLCGRARTTTISAIAGSFHALGLAYRLILAVAGLWLASEFTEMTRIQDCVLSGRSGCIPLNVAADSY